MLSKDRIEIAVLQQKCCSKFIAGGRDVGEVGACQFRLLLLLWRLLNTRSMQQKRRGKDVWIMY